MTKEIKKLIESCKSYYFVDGECVLKSDLLHIIEELTRWNKVEDILPDSGVRVLCKTCTRGMGAPHFTYCVAHYQKERNRFSCDFDWTETVEWRYIN